MKQFNTKTILTVTLATFSIILIVGIIYNSPSGNTISTQPQTQVKTVTDDNGPFELTATYTGNSVWTYKVTAQLPNPCVKALVDTLVAESYPEHVTVRVVTSNTGEMCAQVIQDFNYEGTFSASENASIRLSVND